MTKLIAVNEKGYPIGEDHHKAKLTNAEVDMILALHSEGWGYRRLCAKFEVARETIARICRGQVRAQHPARYKRYA